MMKTNLVVSGFLLTLCSLSTHAAVFGCGNTPSDPNKVWIYSGPYSQGANPDRYLPATYHFRAEEAGSFTGSGHTAYWALFRAPNYNSSSFTQVEGTYTSSFNWLNNKSDRQLTANTSGYYCAVVTSAHHNSCNNRCFLVQNAPTATGSVQQLPSGYTTVNSTVNFTGNGTIDLNAKQSSLSFQWDFDDGQTSASQYPVHAFSKAGTYFVRLKAFDGTYYSPLTLVTSLWVRGPAQAPRTASYHYGYCSHSGRVGDFNWERSGTDFELQIQSAGYWIDLYKGNSNSVTLTLADYGPQTFRVRALDADFGPASSWKIFEANIQQCSGGGGVDPV